MLKTNLHCAKVSDVWKSANMKLQLNNKSLWMLVIRRFLCNNWSLCFSQHCQLTVDDAVGLCMNTECPVSSGLEQPDTYRVFDLRVTLADHTGSLPNCRVCSSAAAQALNLSVCHILYLVLLYLFTYRWCLICRKTLTRSVKLWESWNHPSKG